ncbi:MAG: hypothetical protein EPN21_01485 [Methylococcaceae bacterium]|nr:MAG: hypothetical protein EPN21_01485 [Methylococcaceae bacterium]
MRQHGTACPAFLEALIQDLEGFSGHWRELRARFIVHALPQDAGGQAQRVAERFALVAMAGEMASRYGITGWQPGEAWNASVTCYTAWIDKRGGAGNKEKDAIF